MGPRRGPPPAPATPQPTLITLDVAREHPSGTIVNVAGVVRAFLPPKTTSSGEYMCTLTLCDPSCESGLRARFFSRLQTELPGVQSSGDVVLLLGMKVSSFRGETMLLPGRSFVLVHEEARERPPGRQLVAEEELRMSELQSCWQGKGEGAVTDAVQDRFALIRDMGQQPGYYDMVGKVVKMFPTAMRTEIYVTDFTSNQQLYEYSRTQKRWEGPIGKYTLQVTLWGINNREGRKQIRVGQYLFLRNMRVKWDTAGTILEGALHDDGKNLDRKGFAVLEDMNDPRVRAVVQREKDHAKRHMDDVGEEAPKDPTVADEADDAEIHRNPEIFCPHLSVPVWTVGQILDLTVGSQGYMNHRYHIVCRVIDYLPTDLKAFAADDGSEDDEEDEDDLESFAAEDGGSTPKARKWVWRFGLLVGGTDGRTMLIIVTGKDAEFLLGLHASELRNDPHRLELLQSKMRILLGGLEPFSALPVASSRKRRRWRKGQREKEEAKRQKLEEASEEAQPFFDACIAEAGPQGKRSWFLFGTNIKDID